MNVTRRRPRRAVALIVAVKDAGLTQIAAGEDGSVTVTTARNGFAKTYAAP